MDETIITWNVPNWITIVLMVALGFALLSLITHGGKLAMRSGSMTAGGMNNAPDVSVLGG